MHHRMEIAYSRVRATLELPCDLKRPRSRTEYRDGLLLVRHHSRPIMRLGFVLLISPSKKAGPL